MKAQESDIFNDSDPFSEDISVFDEDSFKPRLYSQEAYEEFSLAFIEAAMSLASQKGWRHFTLQEAALDANIPLAWVRQYMPSKNDLLKKLNRHIDVAAFDERMPLNETSLRERLFDLVMRRCDGLQNYRQGFLSLLSALPFAPSLASHFAAGNIESVTWIADVAGLDRKGIKGFFRLQALGLLWANILRVWAKDESEELEETMRLLNEGLDKLEKFNLLLPSEQVINTIKSS